MITWKKPSKKITPYSASEEPGFSLMSFTRYVHKYRRKSVGEPPGGYINKAVFIVNQDGLQHRDLNHFIKSWFRNEIMKQWHSTLPELPKPFTGSMEVHSHEGRLGEVNFIPKL